jgi:Putative Actinobacterial Holin-X, holin superfamily III
MAEQHTASEHRVGPKQATGELLREALDATHELVRLEVALGREELNSEVAQAKTSGIVFGAAGALVVTAVTMFLVTLASAFKTMWLASLVIGAVVLCLAGAVGYVGWRALPARPLTETKARLGSGLEQLRSGWHGPRR